MLQDDNDIFKEMVDDLFTEPPKEEKKKAEGTQQSAAIIDFATNKAMEELETIRQAFLEFQEVVAHLAITPYVFHKIEELGDTCMDMVETLDNKFDADKLSEGGRAKLEEIRKLRARVLTSLWQKYKEEFKEE